MDTGDFPLRGAAEDVSIDISNTILLDNKLQLSQKS